MKFSWNVFRCPARPLLSASWRCLGFVAVFCWPCFSALRADDIKKLWEERTACVVSVEFYVQEETERRPTIANGTVIDRDGTIILSGVVLPTYLPPAGFKNFRVHRPGVNTTEYSKAEYLGFDAVSGWHFIRVEPAGRAALRPVTDFMVKDAPPIAVNDEVWGIGLRNKDENFLPIFLRSNVSFVNSIPLATAFSEQPVAGPQLPVFDRNGAFVGIAAAGYGETFFEYSHSERATPLVLVSGDHSHVFQLASDIVPFFSRIPKNKFGRPLSWLGVAGFQPLPNEVAKYLKLENQSGIVVSDVLEQSPAQNAGLKDRDIIIALDGQPLPLFKPAHAVVLWMERQIQLRAVGATVALTVLRGKDKVEVKAVLTDEPKILREAERKYFERLGFSIREFLFGDVVANRITLAESGGAVVHFVKGNSPVSVAGLRAEDWIREIDGVEIKTYAEAIQKLNTIEEDTSRQEFVMLASRAGETSVLRVRLR